MNDLIAVERVALIVVQLLVQALPGVPEFGT